MKNLEEIEKYLKEKQERENILSNSFIEKVTEARKKLIKCDQQLQQAKQEMNTEKYLELKNEKQKATDVVEMYSDMETSKIKGPLLTQEEYKQVKSSIHSIANKIGQQQLDEANKLVNKLMELSDEITSNYLKANELIRIANNDQQVWSTEEYKGNKALWITKEINILSNQIKYARGEK